MYDNTLDSYSPHTFENSLNFKYIQRMSKLSCVANISSNTTLGQNKFFILSIYFFLNSIIVVLIDMKLGVTREFH